MPSEWLVLLFSPWCILSNEWIIYLCHVVMIIPKQNLLSVKSRRWREKMIVSYGMKGAHKTVPSEAVMTGKWLWGPDPTTS